jgi:hypothetical protein
VVVYLALQLLIPLRHWLYPGNVSWTEEGHRFAWHMKLRDKAGRLAIEVTDPVTGQTWPVDLSQDLTPRQIREMSTRPDMILQYGHYLREKWRQAGIATPIITANAWVSLNGRPYQPLIDPEANLAEINVSPFTPAQWILPLHESLSHNPIPVVYLLTVTVMLLSNVGLAVSGYFAVVYYRQLKTAFPGGSFLSCQSGPADRTMPISKLQVAEFIKVMANLLPYLLVLLSLAAWTVTGELVWLTIALTTTILATAWAFYLAPTLTSRSDRSYPLCLAPVLLNLLTDLFLLMITIAAAQN